MCAFFDGSIINVKKNKEEFIKNLGEWKKSGINLVTAGLQGPNPFREYYKKARERDKTKDMTFRSSAINSDGSLDKNYLKNLEEIITAANNAGIYVLLNILSTACEDIFEDEYALLSGIFNAADMLLEKNYPNVFVNLTDVSHTFFKSSVLCGEGLIEILKSVREKIKRGFLLGAGIKTFSNIGEKKLSEYIRSSDFIPVYANQAHSRQTTKNMLEKIFFFKEKIREAGEDLPLIVAKGDDLSEKYNSYGKNNLSEAMETGASWCYYDLAGFVVPQSSEINWGKYSSPAKANFFKTAEKYKFKLGD